MRAPLRGREPEVLRALAASIQIRGRMPTQKELCFDVGIYPTSLTRILYRLSAKGYLHKLPRGALAYQIDAAAYVDVS